MTLLRLSPDSERLRRIAKAHAAGELATIDYRRIRAEVIEGFAQTGVDTQGDDTEPRWLYRPIAPAIRTDPPLPRSARAASSPLWTWSWVIVVLVIVIAVVAVVARERAPAPSARQETSTDRTGALVPSAAGAPVARSAVIPLTQSLQTTL
ncbi:MAG TPA: hypothetical protein VIZ30_06290 [Pseudomonadales bacterium]